jgi:hypothetical protein
MIQTLEITRSAKSGGFNVVLIHIGTILHLSEARQKNTHTKRHKITVRY